MTASRSWLRAAFAFTAFLLVLLSQLRAQNNLSVGTIPNERCPETNVAGFSEGWFGDERDAGVGLTTVSVYGTAERRIPMPEISSGLQGVAALYHRALVVDVTNTAWDGSSPNLKGGGIPLPNLDPANLQSDVPGSGRSLQPRPGTMPGLYLYSEGNGKFYQYGGPISTGANPQNAAVYGDSTVLAGSGGPGGSGEEGPVHGPPMPATLVYTNNLSGAQLWHYQAGNYYEVKHVDGSVARFDVFTPWTAAYASLPANAGKIMLRVTSVTDPYDNKADYVYDTQARLDEIRFPSGLTQKFEWDATWNGWTGNAYDMLGVEYSQDRFGGQGPVPLPDLTWGLVFHKSGSRHHFGAKLFRTYSAKRDIVDDKGSGHFASPPASTQGHVVHELIYSSATGSPDVLDEWQRIDSGSFTMQLVEPVALVDQLLLATAFDPAGRVVSQARVMGGEALSFAYPVAGFRTTDLLPTFSVMAGVEVTDASASTARFEFDRDSGHVYSVIFEPSDDYAGRPRKHHATAENAGIGGVATTAIEPERYEIYNKYDSTCVCQKPIERQIRSTVSGVMTTRTTNYTYDPVTKLVTERRVPNPEAGPSSPAPQVIWSYTYIQAPGTQSWGAWLLESEATPDGTFWYSYTNLLDRNNAADHGRIAGTVTRRISGVLLQTTLENAPVASAVDTTWIVHRNLSNSPGGFPPSPASGLKVKGQPRWMQDGDLVGTVFDYTAEGWLASVDRGGVDSAAYAFDDYGAETSVTENVAAVPVSLVASWTVTPIHALGAVAARASSSASANRGAEYYFDRFGHLVSRRLMNKSSANVAPARHGGSPVAAREWIETQWHYQHTRLGRVYSDRDVLDAAAGAAQFLLTSYVYDIVTARLDHTENPNGSRTYYDFDGYGTLYRSYDEAPSGSGAVRGPKSFVSPFLEVVGSYEFTDTEHLWTIIDRNLAGAITRIVEPSTAAPVGYTPANGVNYSTGGAEHVFELDDLGRVTRVTTMGGAEVLADRSMRYDQLSRRIWQYSIAKMRSGNSSVSAGDHYVAWEFEAGRETQLAEIWQTGLDNTVLEYWPSGLMKSSVRSGDRVDYEYYSGTTFLKSVDRADVDPITTLRVTATDYDVDPFGQVLKIQERASHPTGQHLDHHYAYNSFGQVDTYTDPKGLAQKFLQDALGRNIEHARVGSSSSIVTWASFTDFGQADGRTIAARSDDVGNQTTTYYDFAGRPVIVQNPGAGTIPTQGSPHQALSLYAEYDGASRLAALYDGDYGITKFARDGMGRAIKRWLELPASGPQPDKIAGWNAVDWLRRDGLGRIEQNDYYADPAAPTIMGVGQTFRDSIGRVHRERYNFALAASNVIETVSTYSGGDPYRAKLDYLDGLDQPFQAPWQQKLKLDFTHDTRGRLDSLSWNTAGTATGGTSTLLASYGWAGGLRRTRQMTLGGSFSPQFDSVFSYDEFGRLTQIKDEFSDTDPLTPGSAGSPVVKSQFDYTYDEVGNLTKEAYAKVDGSAGNRFAYDEFHRLATAWMGVASTVMLHTGDPGAFSATTMHERLTYGLDGASNRTATSSETAASGAPLIENYVLQASGAQGPSNRYASVSQAAVGGTGAVVPYEYDGRGNLTCDGNFVYKYDYMNRLQEVWRIVPDAAAATGGAASSEKYAEVDEGALDDAREDVKLEVPDLYQRLIHEHMDPIFRNRLRASITGGIINMTPTASGGGMPGFAPVSGTLELTAVFTYDAGNRRTMSIWVGIATWFHTYDGWREVGEYGLEAGHAVPIKQFVWGAQLDELIGYRHKDVYGAGQWSDYHLLHGGQNTSAKLVDEDGKVVEHYEYSPYGGVSVYVGASTVGVTNSSVGLPFLWKGLRQDAVTGLVYMRNRFYSPGLGRFVSLDPLGVHADALNFGNGYSYVGCRPGVAGDPYGQESVIGSPSPDREKDVNDRMNELRDRLADVRRLKKKAQDLINACEGLGGGRGKGALGAAILDDSTKYVRAAVEVALAIIGGKLKGPWGKGKWVKKFNKWKKKLDEGTFADRRKAAYKLKGELEDVELDIIAEFNALADELAAIRTEATGIEHSPAYLQ